MEKNISSVPYRQQELPNHEYLSDLALNDPQAYEDLRQKLINSFIESSPDRIKSRLLGIQFRVDSIRSLSKSPLGSTIRISKLMWESFYNLNQAWQDFIHLRMDNPNISGSSTTSDNVTKPSAKILTFTPRSGGSFNK
jgi:hypothetical protein